MINVTLKKVKKTLYDHCKFFKDNVYLIMAIARKKDNDLTKGTEVVIRDVLRKEKDIERRYPRLRKQVVGFKEDGEPINFYMYVSCNPRDARKGFYNFLKRQINWARDDHFDDESVDLKVKKLDRYWMSEIQKPQNKAWTNFLWDVDDKSKLEEAKELTGDLEIKMERETKNGYHLITDAFDYTELDIPEWLTIKKDAPLFLEYIDNRGN